MENKECGSSATSCSTEKKECGEKKDGGSCSTAKTDCGGGAASCCPGVMIKGTLVGALVMFAWIWVSWTVLPWHKNEFARFGSEPAVAAVLAKEAPAGGLYVLPHAAAQEKAAAQPYAFVSVYNKGTPADERQQLLLQALLCLLGGALLTKFLKKAPEACCPVGCSLALGVFVGAFAHLPNVIWLHFPLGYALTGMADCVIAITLAGMAISCCVLKRGKGACGGGCGCGGKCPCCAGAGCCTGKCGGKCPCPCCVKSNSCGSKPAGGCGDKAASCSGEKPAGSCGSTKKGGCGS